MSETAGSVHIDRTVASIRVGNRHRTDLGDIDSLAASIRRDGLLQPITVTPDGFLVCGARRLAALKLLGIRTVSVWVRSGMSDRLGQLLAEQDDNQLHKPFNQVEAAALYRELKALMAEDAAHRQAATRFSSDHQPGENDSTGNDSGENGAGDSPAPSSEYGQVREQAARMVTGTASYKRLEQISYLEQIATGPRYSDELRDAARIELDRIQAGGPVDPAHSRIRALAASEEQRKSTDRDTELHRMADEALARVRGQKPNSSRPHPAAAGQGAVIRLGVRAFVLTWSDLEAWWDKYDPALLAGDLTDEQAEAFYATVEGTVDFAEQLRTARNTTTAGAGEDLRG